MTDYVFVYRHCAPDVIDRRTAALPRLLAAPGPGEPLDPVFVALPGGAFRWRDRGRLRSATRGVDILETPAQAEMAAMEFMAAANRASAGYREAQRLDVSAIPDPFPTTGLVRAGTRRVAARPGQPDDHWLSSWFLVISAGPDLQRDRALVLGATIDVRVGVRGRVVGVYSSIRPWQDAVARPLWPWETDADPSGAGHPQHGAEPHARHDHREVPPRLVYLLDPPHERQSLLAPFWMSPRREGDDHHTRHLRPASDYSLAPEILVDEARGEAAVYALVAGKGRAFAVVEHGGKYRLRWAVADLPAFLAGEREVTSATYALLPGPGLYQVALEVEHVATGAVRSTHRQIAVARPPARDQTLANDTRIG